MQKKVKVLPHFLFNMIKKDEINVFEHLGPGLHLNFKGFSLILCIYVSASELSLQTFPFRENSSLEGG